MSDLAAKLGMDFVRPRPLRGGMIDATLPASHDDLIRQLFALLTAKFEDGAAIAAEGQAPGMDPAGQGELANRLVSLAEEISILADAVVALTGERPL